jgi:hypothetical protein
MRNVYATRNSDTDVTVYMCHMLQRNIEQCPRAFMTVFQIISTQCYQQTGKIKTIENPVIGKLFATAGEGEHNVKVQS